MADQTVALCLVDPANDFQQAMRADAESAARRNSLKLEVHFSGHDLPAQLNMIRACIDAEPKPRAILVLATRDKGLARMAKDAVKAGIAFVYLNRTEDDIAEIRREFPSTPVTVVCADELETGRIQGRLFRSLLPDGGTVLYVQGSKRSLAARDRTAGMEEAVRDAKLDVVMLEAGWSADEARQAVKSWLGIVARGNKRIDLVGCQNDQIAIGALDALRIVASDVNRPELGKIPVVGCDGTPTVGQKMVNDGQLVATVVLPRSVGAALDRVARLLNANEIPPPLVTLAGSPYPERVQPRKR
jgi:ABC-type sugar transport system substrate-binding protein